MTRLPSPWQDAGPLVPACPPNAHVAVWLNLTLVEEEEEEEGGVEEEVEVEMEMGPPPLMDNNNHLPVDATMPLSCRGKYLGRGTTLALWGEEDWRWEATLWWQGQTEKVEEYH